MANANAIAATPSEFSGTDRLEQAGLIALTGVAAALQFSIAVAQSCLAIAVLCWLALVLTRRERIEVPRFFYALLALGALTLVSAAFSPEPRVSFVDSKQLVLFSLVPLTYRFAVGKRATMILLVIVTVGAASAAFGIVQYGILHYDHLGQRPHGTLGHYMTYSGLLMLVIGAALAQALFGRNGRVWAALVMPALAVAVTLTFTRSAWVGACAAAALLLSLKDFRLMALLPVLAALFFGLAPSGITARFLSIFDLNDPTNRDRLAMMREGDRMIRAHPLVGVGPNMVEVTYATYRDARAVEKVNPHLHNVPLQIAAERGLPALAAWCWFVVVVFFDLVRSFRLGGPPRAPTAAALAGMVAMLAAGFFEYNFGDSEFLMLLLLLVTLPFAAARPAPSVHA
jgi:putative inorganic carbon (HCO3(-)) transporter